MDWRPISTAPNGRDLRLGVIDGEEVHSLVFPCHLVDGRWIDSAKGTAVDVNPTHWRFWNPAK